MTKLDTTRRRILGHYERGTAITSIAMIVGWEPDEVRDFIAQTVGFDRKKAGALLRRPVAPASVPPRHVAPSPPKAKPAAATPAAPATPPKSGRQEASGLLRPPPLTHGQRLNWWDAHTCLSCMTNRFLPGRCCGADTVPSTVTVTYREVP